MSFAPTSNLGARLKARLAVNGIHSSSSDGSAPVDAADGALSVSVAMIRVVRGRASDDEMRFRAGTATLNMWIDLPIGEEMPMSDSADDLEEVQRRLAEIQRRKRGRVRWHVGRHTAEMAIDAIERGARSDRKNGKQRRRKRRKRLL